MRTEKMKALLRHMYHVAKVIPFSSSAVLVPIPLGEFFRGREVQVAAKVLREVGFLVIDKPLVVKAGDVELSVGGRGRTYVLFNVAFVASFPSAKEFVDYVLDAIRNRSSDPHLRPVRLDQILAVDSVRDGGDGGDHRQY